jgi:DNA polymerase III subunit beta
MEGTVMKFLCDKEALFKEISTAYEVISTRNVLSILSNVYLETDKTTLKIKASDLKVGFESSIPVHVEASGSVTVYCEKLLKILRELPSGEVSFELKDNMMFQINPVSKKINFQLKSISTDKFPEIPEIGEDQSFELAQKDFIEMVSNTIFAISDDETRFFMNGGYPEKIDNKAIMVASDGRILSFIAKNIEGSFNDVKGIIIPSKILAILNKLISKEGNLLLAVTEKNFFAKFGNHKFSSNLIEGKFPNYQKVIPDKQQHKLIVDRKILENAVRRVSVLVEQKSRRVYLVVNKDNIIVSSDESEMGLAKEEIPCQYDGPDAEIILNYIYLLDPLKEMTEESIAIEFTNPEKTITIKPIPERDIVHIIMPMQKK